MRIIDQFCDAYRQWDGRSAVGDVYLTAIMQFLGGHARRGNNPYEPGEYSLEAMREELEFLTGEMHMDAAFLIASIVRAVESELVEASESYGAKLGEMRRQTDAMERMLDAYQGPIPEHAQQGLRSLLKSAWSLHEHPADAPRPDQQRVMDWRDLMAPVTDRDNLERAYEEQWGEPE
jgi:hypothetical protein